MKVYLCNMWNGAKQTWICVGIFPTKASAEGAGSDYLSENARGELRVCDWEEEHPISKYWYSDEMGHSFTRIITECEIGKRLV